jgi:hypothetical protein
MGMSPIGAWHDWFAWYPVQVVDKQAEAITGYRFYRRIWLKTVWRRRIRVWAPGQESATIETWEYDDRDLFEIIADERL